MSVLIKGMNIPKTCEKCKFRKNESVTNVPLWVCIINGQETFYCDRSDGSKRQKIESKFLHQCPLVEVPAPHGRLIDADNLIERIDFETKYYVVRDDFSKGRAAGWNNVRRAADKYMPIIVEAEQEAQEG